MCKKRWRNYSGRENLVCKSPGKGFREPKLGCMVVSERVEGREVCKGDGETGRGQITQGPKVLGFIS